MPRPDTRPPGAGDAAIGVSPQPPPGRARTRFRPAVSSYTVREWLAHPVSVAQALGLADVYGRAIRGQRGTIATGASRARTGQAGVPGAGFTGYAQPPQLFTGWNPAYQTATGTPLRDVTGSSLPATSPPLGTTGNPMDNAMAQIMAGSR